MINRSRHALRRHNARIYPSRCLPRRRSSNSTSKVDGPTPVVPAIASLLSARYTPSIEETITVNGFVRSVRRHGKVAFAAIQDGSAVEPLQVVLTPSQSEPLTNGAGVRIKGRWLPCPKGRQQSHELHCSELTVLGASDPETFPIQKHSHSLEHLRSIPHLRARMPFNSLLLRLRSRAIARLTKFFGEHGFVQVHPPVLSCSDCEGAGEVFSISAASDTHGDGVAATEGDAHSRPRYLTVSSQLHLEALAQSVGKVWALAPTFRAERSDTARHVNEFYMLEAEVGFADELEDIMGVTQDALTDLVYDLSHSALGQELLLAKRNGEGREDDVLSTTSEQLHERWRGMLEKTWPRVTYASAVQLLEQAVEKGDVRFDKPPSWWGGLRTDHERYIAETVGQGRPVFVTHYPRHLKPFYMAPSRPAGSTASPETAEIAAPAAVAARHGPGPGAATVACFDLLVPDLCELAGGSMREHSLEGLLESMRRHGLSGATAATAATATATGGSSSSGATANDHRHASASSIVHSSVVTTTTTTTTTATATSGTIGPLASPSTDESVVPLSRASGPGSNVDPAMQHVDPALQWYVDLRRWGSVPHGGFGLGFDRLLCYLSGVSNVKDMVTFPRWAGKGHC